MTKVPESPNVGHPQRRAMDRIVLYLQPGVVCEVYRSPEPGDPKKLIGPSEPVGRVFMNAKRQLWFERDSDGKQIHLAGGRNGKSHKSVPNS